MDVDGEEGGGTSPGIPFEITQGISVPRLSRAQCEGDGVYRGAVSGADLRDR